MKLNGAEVFEFELKFQKPRLFRNQTLILEKKFIGGSSLFKFGYYRNGSLWVDSDFFEERFIFKSNVAKLKRLAIHIGNNSSFLKINEGKFDLGYRKSQKRENSLKVKLAGLENVKNKKLRIFKLDSDMKIKNFYYRADSSARQINVMLGDCYNGYIDDSRNYVLVLDNEKRNNQASFIPPARTDDGLSRYVHSSRQSCKFAELSELS